MITFKRITALILALAMLFLLIACGEYNPATGGQNGSGGTGSGGSGNSGGSDDDFTVQLMLNGQPFVPKTKVEIYWNDGYNIHTAVVNDKGYASVSGLDGDYEVTLSSVPEGYAYDANGYIATNDLRNIFIEMYDLNLLKGQGTSSDESYEIENTGVYTVTVRDENDFNFIRFAPQHNGIYTVESWVSAVEDEVNPICMAYLGSSEFVYGEYKVESFGICGSYTQNFIHEVNIANENISSGGSVTFTFAIGAETKSGVYPVNITFAIKRNGDFDTEKWVQEVKIPSHDWSAFDFDAFNALAGGKLVGADVLYPGTTDTYILDQRNYKLWPVSEGGDGVYHVYNKEKYPDTNGYGPILVAYIDSPCAYNELSFTHVEDPGNSALVVNGNANYRLFIKGFETLANQGFYCCGECSCHDGAPDEPRACLTGCAACHRDCKNVTEEMMRTEGYVALANADGVVPVTPEIIPFLQGFAITQRYFADGGGWVDGAYWTRPDGTRYYIDAYEDSQWLFACAYYE